MARITGWQALLLAQFAVTPTTVLLIPAAMSRVTGRDAWLAPLVAAPAVLAAALTWTALVRRFPGLSLAGITRRVLGRAAGSLVSLLFAGWTLVGAAVITREHAEFIHILIPETPLSVVVASILLVCAAVARCGVAILSRCAEAFAFGYVLGTLLIWAFVLPELHPNWILPPLENGWGPVLRGALYPLGLYVEPVLLLVWADRLQNPRTLRPVVMLAVTGSLAGTAVGVLLATMLFGARSLARLTFPFYEVVRMATVADFVERLDPIVMGIWTLGLFLKISIWLLAAVTTVTQGLGLRDHRHLVLPLTVLTGALCLADFGNIRELAAVLSQVGPVYLMLGGVGLPALLWAAVGLRGLHDRLRGRRAPAAG